MKLTVTLNCPTIAEMHAKTEDYLRMKRAECDRIYAEGRAKAAIIKADLRAAELRAARAWINLRRA